MTDIIHGIRGMHDLLPADSARWLQVEDVIRALLARYGYRQIRLPIVERTELFEHSIGETSDIVSKEMYTFADRNGDRLTLRPEGTAGCVRAAIEHGLLNDGPQRLWYLGPMFRHERPQKGRYRQFHQVGAEALGFPGPDIDAELILVTARLWRELGIDDAELEINSLGSPESRQRYRAALVEYFSAHLESLDDDARARLGRNPLRLLDSKDPELQPLIEAAPEFAPFLDPQSQAHFAALRELLDGNGVTHRVNARMVRGLDYYTGTVFEWTSGRLGAQSAICAGGRYDGLFGQFGGSATPAIGWAMGLERILDLVAGAEAARAAVDPHVYLVCAPDCQPQAMHLAERLRGDLPALRIVLHCGGGSLKSQFKKADRSGALLTLVLGADEVRNGTVGVKPLRGTADQQQVPAGALAETLAQKLNLVGGGRKA
jgi:histidyl-tRNA synthetase